MLSGFRTVASAWSEALAASVEGLNLELIQGEVFMVYPALGSYLILPKHGDGTGQLTICCAIEGSIGRSGVRGGSVYEAGDDVLVARYKSLVNFDKLDGKAISYIGYILSAAPPQYMTTVQGYPGANIHSEEMDYWQQTMTDAFASTKKLKDTLRDLSYGSPNDTFAGDYTQYGPLHTFLSVCASKASMGASPMAKIETFAFHDLVRISARAFQDRSTSVDSGRGPDISGMFYYERFAIDEREGVGAVGSVAPFREEPDGDVLTKAGEQVGIFRHSRMVGRLVDGEIEALTRPVEEDSTDGEHHTVESHIPLGMVSVRKTYDGRHETRAAGGIDHVKSLYVPVPEYFRDHTGDTYDNLKEVEFKDKYEVRKEEDFDGNFSPYAAIEEATERDEDEYWYRNTTSREREDNWRTLSREQVEEQYQGVDVMQAPRQLQALARDKQFYDEPPSVDIKDQIHAGLERRLYALESMIRQMPDGTVLISDGHGSEIRMYRGRISISAASDLELRPGRDCIELVPRRKVINAGDELQLVSNDGKVRIKAETDVDVLAANGGVGRLLLESRGNEAESTDLSGIHLRTNATLNMTGANLYMGIKPPADVNPGAGGFDRNSSGLLTIDARQGIVNMFGGDLYGHFLNNATLSTKSAVFGMQSGTMTLVGSQIRCATTLFRLAATTGAALIPRAYFASGGTAQDFINLSGKPTLELAGDLKMTGSIQSTGSIEGKTIGAESAGFTHAGKDSGVLNKNFKAPNVHIDTFNVKSLADLSEAFTTRIPGQWGDAGLLGAHFQFDKPPAISQENYEIQMMRWQSMLLAGGSTTTWAQKPVTAFEGGDTYAYPGYGPEDTGTPLVHIIGADDGRKLERKPFDGYIVNK